MDEIPKDVAKEAWGVLQEMIHLPDRYPSYKKIEIIARAIMAERERCGKVADDYAKRAFSAIHPSQEAGVAALKIESAIRNPSTK